MGRPASGKWRAEPRSEPDSGHPTVRDRRGALGDVTHGEPRNPTRKSKERLWSLLAYRCARPGSIPTTRTSGSVGGQGQQRPWSTRPHVGGGSWLHQEEDDSCNQDELGRITAQVFRAATEFEYSLQVSNRRGSMQFPPEPWQISDRARSDSGQIAVEDSTPFRLPCLGVIFPRWNIEFRHVPENASDDAARYRIVRHT